MENSAKKALVESTLITNNDHPTSTCFINNDKYLSTNNLSIGFGILVKHTLGHLGIAMDALEILVAHLLDMARCHYPLAYGGRRFSRFERRQFIEGDRP